MIQGFHPHKEINFGIVLVSYMGGGLGGRAIDREVWLLY